MQEKLKVLSESAKKNIIEASDLASVLQLRVQYLGKKGSFTQLMQKMAQLEPSERPKFGKLINIAKQEVQTLIAHREKEFRDIELEKALHSEKIDVTLDGRGQSLGSLHPVSRVTNRVVSLFNSLGFSVAEGPEIEDEYHNFSALNFSDYHPAKEAQDTFYFSDGRLLRTHTSPVQIRVMKEQSPPLRVITPGRVYRRDSDVTHTPMFHQLEGLVIDKLCTFSDLKGLLQNFLNQFFESDIRLRFRPGYFPFTEPSAEVDIEWTQGIDESAQSKWLEVLGCGMVHPNVLRNMKIDPDEYSGFAFGIGLDRLAMLRYGIKDLRTFFENDMRFLEQF